MAVHVFILICSALSLTLRLTKYTLALSQPDKDLGPLVILESNNFKEFGLKIIDQIMLTSIFHVVR